MQIDTDTPIPLAPTDAWQALPARGAWLAALGVGAFWRRSGRLMRRCASCRRCWRVKRVSV